MAPREHMLSSLLRERGHHLSDPILFARARAEAHVAEAPLGMPATDVLEIIRAAVAGSLKAGLVGGGSLPYDGIQALRIGDWSVRVHIDAGSLDYIDGATAPDGRAWGYREVGGILRGMEAGERRAVQAWLDDVEPV